jgi:hypothetical protein
MGKTVQTDFLFAQPSFGSGVSRVLDLWGTFDDYNRCNTPEEADATAIAADWRIVGQDIYDAIDKLNSERGATK